MTAEQFVDHLRRRGAAVKKTRKGWKVTCPAHADRDPSQCVDPGDRRPVLLHCHAGCSDLAILAAAGLRLADITPFQEGTPALIWKPCCEHDVTEDPLLNLPNVLPVIAAHEPATLPDLDYQDWTVPLPKGAGKAMKAVAADLAAVATERRDRWDHRPIPYAPGHGAARLDRASSTIRDALGALERHGSITKGPRLPATNQNPRGCPTWRLTVTRACLRCAGNTARADASLRRDTSRASDGDSPEITRARASSTSSSTAPATPPMPVAVSWGETSENSLEQGDFKAEQPVSDWTANRSRSSAPVEQEFTIFGETFAGPVQPAPPSRGPDEIRVGA